jgi:hypothetical protein
MRPFCVATPSRPFGIPASEWQRLFDAGVQYCILGSTNLALPLASWTPVWTNVFSADGSYSYTNSLLTSSQSFFILVSP